MRLFLDTANIEQIKEAVELGVISGVTTNPTLVAKEGKDFFALIKEISSLVPGPVSAEVVGLTAPEMIEEAKRLVQLGNNIVVKIPMIKEGLKAVSILAREGIKTNVTLIFSANQALLAARAGATYVSPFVGRNDELGLHGMDLVADIVQIFKVHGLTAEVIAAAMRNPLHTVEAAKAGAHIATINHAILMQMIEHPMTKIGLERFLADWESVQKK